MTTSATQPGVQTETTATTTDATGTADASAQNTTTTATGAADTTAASTSTEPVLTDREKVMEQITRQNDERMAAEHTAAGVQAPVTADTTATTTTQPDDQLTTQLEDKPTFLETGLDKVMVRRKIDGVESEVSVADLLRDHQKHGAADKRLDEAARLLREAQAQAAAARTNPPVGVDPKDKAKDITTTLEGEDPKAVAKKIVTALFEGDEATALEAVEKIVAGRQAPTQPDARQLVEQIAPVVKQQLSDESALEKFSKDYKDIVDDPYLATLADTFLEAEVKDPTKSYAEALDAAGKKTRDWLAAKTGTPATTTTPTMDRTQKLERKAGIDNVQALNTKATTVEEPVQSASDVIADMKKQRGLA